MATAILLRERAAKPREASFLPPPPISPHRLPCGMGDEDPEEEVWLRERERLLDEEARAETAFGCDYPDGPLSPNGCRW